MYKNECQFPSKHQDKENKWPQAKAKIPCPQIAVSFIHKHQITQ